LNHITELKIPWVIATSSYLEMAKARMSAADLLFPEVIITAEDIVNGKPDPEHFIKAYQAINLLPEDCLIFEDSMHGVNAAISAGCHVIIMGDLSFSHPKVIGNVSNFNQLL